MASSSSTARTVRTSRYLLVANPGAGGVDDDVPGRIEAVLTTDAPTDQVDPQDPEALDAALKELDGGCVVVAGGDGSLHLVAQRLRTLDRLDLEVALVPTGTGNDFARTAKLPLDATAATAALLGWSARPTDLLASGDHAVVNAVHVGIGAVAGEHATRLKPRWGILAYPLGAVAAAAWLPPWELSVSVDGKLVHEGMTMLAGMGNGKTIGGGTPMFPKARIDDGLASVLVVGDKGRLKRAAFGRALSVGQHRRLPWVHTARGRVIEVHGETVAGNADGEIWPPAKDWRIDVLPGALRLRRP